MLLLCVDLSAMSGPQPTLLRFLICSPSGLEIELNGRLPGLDC